MLIQQVICTDCALLLQITLGFGPAELCTIYLGLLGRFV
jgi:hypothetical protein